MAGGIRVWLGTNNFSKTDAPYFPEITIVRDVPTDYTPYLINGLLEA
ncbi:hypothetical protein [Mucilaginibacter aquariorum]|uniref:Uncharacterized protein n=1 Tax=Mucilaginibacter aquariorum TaxID=2967225 RepID=A0ABT1SZD6_9SPHI|nr:hypothetical protein [Mucilaginibacter aquariorum]MCQ6957716.1 hypothetical protein [Mucilaginibacter aquariorum]